LAKVDNLKLAASCSAAETMTATPVCKRRSRRVKPLRRGYEICLNQETI
jgi:hypothetical protein